MLTRLILAFALVALPMGAVAQDRARTLADIRQELNMLFVQIQRLRGELNTTGGASGATGGTGLVGRVEALEVEVRRLTATTEELEFRIEQIVADGTNRIGDLEFRLVELEGGDPGKLGVTTTLGGETTREPVVIRTPTVAPAGVEMAVGEQADFDAAMAAFESGDHEVAAEAFGAFVDTYPGGPLSSRAMYFRGEALAGTGEWSKAARAYLTAFSGDPGADIAPDSLLKLGISLDRIGQREEACLTLREVGARYPSAAAVADAGREMARMNCS